MTRFHNIDGVKVQFTAEEETEWDNKVTAFNSKALERALATLRGKRNKFLAETDYLALSDATLTSDMKTYRQALRDLPDGKDTVEKCEDATFPTKP